ncbi:MAG: NADH-quinone oxidoreductase subunit M, partial [Gemmatimonadetes bacterium]|nr:NADH-quinone oxidoreductase subunit M [Gemmatimonadota bacterium]
MTIPSIANLLSWLIWLPIAAGGVVLLLGERRIAAARWIALAASLAALALCVPLWQQFDVTTPALQFIEQEPWIGALNAWYHLGIDGIALPLIVLTAFTTPLVVIAAWTTIENRPAQFFAAFLVMEGLMIGVFAAADALLFYVFWEAMLIP